MSFYFCRCFNICRVRSGIRLGERITAENLPACKIGQKPLLLVFVAENHYRKSRKRNIRAPDKLQAWPIESQTFAYDRSRHCIHSHAAVFFGKRNTHEAHIGNFLHKLFGELALRLKLCISYIHHFFLPEFVNHIPDKPHFLAKLHFRPPIMPLLCNRRVRFSAPSLSRLQ